jgi:histidinol-phosphate aminotransferase
VSRAAQSVHGGTDSAPEPRHDFSSNANSLGPCPSVLAAVRGADLTRYPDPGYGQLRDTLARYHGTTPERIIVGAGASELILRLINRSDGSIQQLAPTFSEYAHGARSMERRLISARSPAAFLRAQTQHPGLGFVCWPNNPGGEMWPLDFVAAAAAAGPLVVDLAYAPLCDARHAAEIEAAAAAAYRLYSPNKAFGLTGVRGAYVVAPRIDRRIAAAAPSWVIGRDAVAFLEAGTDIEARQWLAQKVPLLHRLRARLALGLRQMGLQVRESPATFLMTKVGDAARICARLRREHGIRVRDASSFGRREWIRLSAQPVSAQKALLAALARVI